MTRKPKEGEFLELFTTNATTFAAATLFMNYGFTGISQKIKNDFLDYMIKKETTKLLWTWKGIAEEASRLAGTEISVGCLKMRDWRNNNLGKNRSISGYM